MPVQRFRPEQQLIATADLSLSPPGGIEGARVRVFAGQPVPHYLRAAYLQATGQEPPETAETLTGADAAAVEEVIEKIGEHAATVEAANRELGERVDKIAGQIESGPTTEQVAELLTRVEQLEEKASTVVVDAELVARVEQLEASTAAEPTALADPDGDTVPAVEPPKPTTARSRSGKAKAASS